MKCSLYWLLISSAIALPLSNFSVFAETIPLGPTDSYNGDANSTFTPKSTTKAEGTTYSLTGDMSISNAGKGTALTTSCFKEASGDLTFDGNGHSMSFNTIDAGANPGAIDVSTADKSLTLEGFHNLSFVLSPATTVTTGKGAIISKGATNLKDSHIIVFSNNFSAEDGGAISTKTLELTGNTGSISFLQNSATTAKKGGALFCSSTSNISSNLGVISFISNIGDTSGGAICAEGNCTIAGNKIVLFDGNTAKGTTGNGGAICCTKTNGGTDPTLSITGNSKISFTNNIAKGSGGALYAKKLSLSSGEGDGILFSNNSAENTTSPKGGAIAIANDGEISISADNSNITFNDNKVINNGTATRSSVDLGSNAKFLTLRATSGNSIFFYDPVTGEGTASSALNINETPADSSTTYGGSIVFSGERLSETEKSTEGNRKSTFKQPVTLKGGTLILKDGVTVDTNKFDQEATSTLLMDVGTTLSASTEGVTVKNLAINMDSLNNGQATLSATATDKVVSLSGPITLMDNQGNSYENHDLRNPQTYGFVKLSSKNTPTTSEVPESPTLETPTHYGYQGTWATTWVDSDTTTSDPKTKTATIAWTKTGYIPNPERRGNLVPNSLWGSFVDIRAIQDVMNRSTYAINEERGIWGSGIANFFNRNNTPSQQGFRYKSSGYIIGATTPTVSEDIFNVAFCQLFGRNKDRLVTKDQTTAYAGAINFQHIGRMDYITNLLPEGYYSSLEPLSLVFNAQLIYCHTTNDMKTSYTTLPEVESSWNSDGFGIEIGGLVPVPTQHTRWLNSFSPFMKIQLTYAHQEDFKETSTEARSFESSNLFNLAVPVGVRLEKLLNNETASYDLTVAYVPDIVRNNPNTKTTLLISGDSWRALGTNLARQTLLLRAGNHFAFTPKVEMFSQFAYELRGSSRSYNIDLGGKIRF
ncbi:polymorphic outer membrane protein middle domain-containing protein [Chlamydia sp. 17-3921]|uniref:polymorphic outer membrane protein middle domain-containing protein n=1 Tax=Chlamydia sp. 17-3921 TaxID=2675798 RepID=UPI001919422A|nr:polymorphic outer membrane protein middle domain-containing protein [Chlamydia sp. 17-3921]